MTEPGSLEARIADAIGEEMARHLLLARGGTEISIARRVEGSVLAQLIGEDAARHLLLEFGPGNLTLPQGSMRGPQGRKREAKRMLAQNIPVSEIASRCDLHVRTVHKYRAEMRDDNQLQLPFDQDPDHSQG